VVAGGGLFSVQISGGADLARITTVYSGSCSALAFLEQGIGNANIVALTVGAPFTAYVQVSSTPGGTYTIEFTQF
jgi:hypothetical protein